MRIALPAAVLLALAMVFHGTSAVEPSCLIKTMTRYHEAKIAFQKGMHDLIGHHAAHLTELSEANFNLQTALAEQRLRQFSHLARSAPERLTTDRDISKLANFDWTEADQAAWLKADPEARALETRITKLKDQIKDHPDWPALREVFRSRLKGSEEWSALTDRLFKVRSEANAALAACS